MDVVKIVGCRRRSWLCASWHACVCALLVAGGCMQTQDEPATTVSASFTVDDVLGNCVATYAGLRTFQARGLFRDYRTEKRRVATISWDFARPDRCRLQIEMDVALVSGKHWWTYDAASGRYRSHPQFTRTPIVTAASLLSRGVSFLLPAIMTTGERAFGKSRVRGFSDWRVEGVEWHAGHPCYLVSRRGWGSYRGGRLRVWIDQDRGLVRGWALSAKGPDAREDIVMGCSFYDLAVDERLPAQRFQATPPRPILLSLPEGLEGTPGR